MEVTGARRGLGCCLKPLPGERRRRAGTSGLTTLPVGRASPGSPCAPADADVLADFIMGLADGQRVPGEFEHWKREATFPTASSPAKAEGRFAEWRRDASPARGNSLSRVSVVCCRRREPRRFPDGLSNLLSWGVSGWLVEGARLPLRRQLMGLIPQHSQRCDASLR